MLKKMLLICFASVLTSMLALFGFVGCQRAYISNIVLNETYLEMNVGDKTTLTATVDVGISVDIIWTSSNSGVVTVKNGEITAVGEGAASIKASAQGKTAVCTVVVLPSDKLVSIVLDKESLSLRVGATASLSATLLPDDIDGISVNWKSFDTEVAAVQNGLVTGMANGATVVVAYYGDIFAVCRVTVGDAPVLDDMFTFLTLTESDGIVSGQVLEDSVCTFDFNTEIIAGADVSYIVCRDIECTQIVNSKVVSLQNGFNKFYILSTCGRVSKLYQVVIEQLPIYCLVLNTDGCTANVSCADTESHLGIYTEGQNVTVRADGIQLGYVFDGWYNGEQLLSTDTEYTFTMPSQDLTYTAKFKLDSRIVNLDFESTPATFKINGFKEGADTDELIVPEYTTSIGDGAFTSANRITNVTWLAADCTVPNMNSTGSNMVFYQCTLENLHLDKSVKKYSGSIFFGAFAVNVRYNGTVADWCSTIDFAPGLGLFNNSDNLYIDGELIKDLVIPEGVEEIKPYAFCNSKIESIAFPSTLKKIGSCAFFGCRNLTAFNLTDTEVITIRPQAFSYCNSLTGRVILPKTLQSLHNNAFSYTNVTSIVLHSGIQLIGGNIFTSCPNLQSVLFDGNYAQWLNFKKCIDDRNEELFNAILYTSIVDGVGDNPDGYYWRYDGEEIVTWTLD